MSAAHRFALSGHSFGIAKTGAPLPPPRIGSPASGWFRSMLIVG